MTFDEMVALQVHIPRESVANIKEGRIPLLIKQLLPFLRFDISQPILVKISAVVPRRARI